MSPQKPGLSGNSVEVSGTVYEEDFREGTNRISLAFG